MPWMNLNDLKGYTFFLPRTALRYAALRTLTLRHRRPQRRWRQRRWRWRRSDRGKWCTPCACEAGFKNRWKSCSITISINIDHHLYMDLFPNGFQCSSFFLYCPQFVDECRYETVKWYIKSILNFGKARNPYGLIRLMLMIAFFNPAANMGITISHEYITAFVSHDLDEW